jgi:hypothetical protein
MPLVRSFIPNQNPGGQNDRHCESRKRSRRKDGNNRSPTIAVVEIFDIREHFRSCVICGRQGAAYRERCISCDVVLIFWGRFVCCAGEQRVYLRTGLLAPGPPVSMLPVSSATRALILATRDSIAVMILV